VPLSDATDEYKRSPVVIAIEIEDSRDGTAVSGVVKLGAACDVAGLVDVEEKIYAGWHACAGRPRIDSILQKDVGRPQDVLAAYATRSGNSTFSCCWKMSANFSKPAFAG
jgi:hypothetical protein